MFKLLRALAAVFAAIVSIFLGGCNENDVVTPGTEKPNAPTGLMATSLNANTIGLKWTGPITGATPTGYKVAYHQEGVTAETMTAVITGTTTTITGLVEGTKYIFAVQAYNDTVGSTPSTSVTWAPASRTTASLRIYESASDNGSGIELPNSANLTVANGGRWDIGVDTYPVGGAPSFDIGSPSKLSYDFPVGQTARVTLFGKIDTNVASLDDLYETASLDNGGLTEGIINFNNRVNDGKPFAFVVKTQDNHFAKVRVKSNAAGTSVLQGTSPNRYLELEVSYQNVAGIPYALPVKPLVGNSKKMEGSQIVIRDAQNNIVNNAR